MSLDPSFLRLMDLMETQLHYIVRRELSREEAKDIKERIMRPIGVLNMRHGFVTQTETKERIQRLKRSFSVDKAQE